MSSTRFAVLLIPVAFAASAASAGAQTGVPDTSNARLRMGPLYLSPTVSLTNAGIDTNVFNEPDQVAPKRDFTMTVTPAAGIWLRLGRTWFSGNVKQDLVYYKTYSSERASNNADRLSWFIPLNRVSFTVGGDYLNTRDRPGFEIDARSQRVEGRYNGAVEVRVLGKTSVTAKADVLHVDFDSFATFEGVNLEQALNRQTTTMSAGLRHNLTPLTTILFDLVRGEDRFTYSPIRDSDSTEATVGLHFDPSALIKGTARVGYKNFNPLGPEIPDYRGPTAAVDVSYVALGMTRLAVQVLRDVQYSFELESPYYVQTGGTASITQQIFGPVDVVGRIGAQTLAYRSAVIIPIRADRTDHVRSFGGGIGYHIGRNIRVGANVDQQRRTSNVLLRQYDGLRFGTAVTYEY